MTYPNEFKEKVKRLFPDCKKMHDFLDKGSEMAGRYLDDAIKTYTSKQILDNINNDLDGFKEQLARGIEIQEMYREWRQLTRNRGRASKLKI